MKTLFLLAASALILGGSDAQKSEWLPKIADGSAVGALAVDEGPHHRPDKVEATVSGGKLTGKKTFVLEGMAAGMPLWRAALEGVVFQLRIIGWALLHARRDRPI